MTLTMAQFCAARLDEDEAAARDAYYEGQRWITEEEGVYRYPDDELVHMADRKAGARHIARWDPARVLREVEADRKILAEYTAVLKLIELTGSDKSVLRYREFVLQHRAAVHSDHPDYNPDWSPA